MPQPITIQEVEIRLLSLPMTHSFETSFGRLTHKETVIIKLITDAGIGYGEASAFFAPLYNAESVDTCFYILEKFLAPSVVGKTFSTPEEFRNSYSHIVGNHIARAGIEFAFWHARALADNTSLKQMLGGVKDSVAVGESIGIHPTIEATFAEIEQRLQEGYVRIKVKIKPGWDVELMEAVRNKWPNIDLMADANAAYSLKDIAVFQALDKLNLTMIEQPLAEDDIVDHATLQKQLKTPVCLDESIKSAGDARKAIQIGACKIINVKPGRVGGLVESIAIHDLALDQGIGVWCGGMLETGIGRAFNIALASKENFIYPADMSPSSFYYEDDLIEPTYVVKEDGHIDVSNSPGLGYAIREEALERFTTKKVVINS